MAISVLLWDFGDTLADERWMRRAPAGCPAWEASWVAVMADLADGWDTGEVTSAEVFAAMAERTGMSRREVADHARECCRRIELRRAAWRYARERRRPQALVTVNPDLFLDHVVPLHVLTEVFDVIVVSAAERSADKVALCETALHRLGFRGDRSEALLVDNRADLVQAWEATGGTGYLVRNDDELGRDLPRLLGERR